jgi:hypothetical protein
VHLGLADGLPEERDHALGVDRPRADEGLVEEVLDVPVGQVVAAVRRVRLRPTADGVLPGPRDLGQEVDARAHVGAALGVVRRQREQRRGPTLGHRGAVAVEALRRAAERAWVAADLVQGDQAVVAIEGGVLGPLGHHGRGELLHAQREVGLERVGMLEQQQCAHEAEQLGVDLRPARADPLHGLRHARAVDGARRPSRVDVRAVHGERGDHLAHDVRELALIVVALAPVLLARRGQGARHALGLRRQLVLQDVQLRVVQDVVVRDVPADEARVAGGERRLVGAVHEEAVHAVQELVAGRAVDGPRLDELLVRREDLLHDRPDAAGRGAEAAEVRLRLAEAVDVVQPEPVDRAAADQLEDQAVGLLEDACVLHAEADERLDVEEAAVVQLLARGPPERQAVVLAAEERVERVGVRVERGDRAVERRLDARVGREALEALAEHLLLPMPLCHGARVGHARVRQASQRDGDLGQLRRVGHERGARHQVVERPRREGQLVLVVAHDERAAAPLHAQLPRLEDAPVVVAEDRYEHRAADLVGTLPVDVEERRPEARRPVLEDVPPPAIRRPVYRHVVGDDVEHVSEPDAGERGDQTPERWLAAELVVQTSMVDDVVAMRAAGRRLQVWRAVEVADAEGREVVCDRRGIVEREAGVQLHAIGGARRPTGEAAVVSHGSQIEREHRVA